MSDAQLMQYLHDELGERERSHIDEQLAATPAAAERLRVLRHRSARLSALLAAVDPAPAEMAASVRELRPIVADSVITHASWWRRTPPVLRSAAVIALLCGAALLVEPVRAWVLEQARAVAEASGLIDAEPATVAPVAPAAGSDVRFSFPWSSNMFDIAAGSVTGTLIITAEPAGQVSAEITGASATSFMITPSGIRIEGAGAVGAIYTVTLPETVTTLRLIRDGRTVEYAIPLDGSALRLPLD